MTLEPGSAIIPKGLGMPNTLMHPLSISCIINRLHSFMCYLFRAIIMPSCWHGCLQGSGVTVLYFVFTQTDTCNLNSSLQFSVLLHSVNSPVRFQEDISQGIKALRLRKSYKRWEHTKCIGNFSTCSSTSVIPKLNSQMVSMSCTQHRYPSICIVHSK